IGERRGLFVGIAVVAVSSLLAGLAQSYPQLLVLRGVGGVGSALFGVGAMSLVLRVAGRQIRGRAMGTYRMGFLVGGIAGPALGGAVLGISLRAPFFLYAGTLALAAAVVLLFVTRPGSSGTRPADRAVERGPEAEQEAETDSETPPGAEQGAPEETESQAHTQTVEPGFAALLRTREYQAALVANFAVGIAVFGLRSSIVPLLFVN